MMKVAIIGAGPAGLFAAYQFQELGAEVTVFDKGSRLSRRFCPDVDCNHCKANAECSILCGQGGAGGYSDGKLTLSTGRGVQTNNELDFSQYQNELYDVDMICLKFNSNSKLYNPVEKLKCLQNINFGFESFPLRHYGTGGIRRMFSEMVKYMEDTIPAYYYHVRFLFETTVLALTRVENGWKIKSISPDFSLEFEFDKVVLATGSYDSNFMVELANSLAISLKNDGDAGIGIRLETWNRILEPLMAEFYDFKLYQDNIVNNTLVQFRSFCVNRGGTIVNEHRFGLTTINGRSEDHSTSRSNLAILAKIPNGKKYVKDIAVTMNRFGSGLPVWQTARRFMDRAIYEADNGENLGSMNRLAIRNTKWFDVISAFPEDLGDGFRHYLAELEKALPGLIGDPFSLVYAPEIKYHMPSWPLGKGFVVEGCPGLQVIGNAAGYTDSISTAAVMGLVAARHIMT